MIVEATDLDSLKIWLQRDISKLDKLLILLSSFECPSSISDLVEKARVAGFRSPAKWNCSQILSRSGGRAIRGLDGWELTALGRQHLGAIGLSQANPAAVLVAADLRKYISTISDEQTRDFLDEAVKCHELGLYRSAIVMSWLGAVDVLQKYVCDHYLVDFNNSVKSHRSNWKTAKNRDDIGKLPEGEFLDRLENISIIGKNVKAQLKTALALRNGCGHPNSMKVGINKSAAHIETLLQNVFTKF